MTVYRWPRHAPSEAINNGFRFAEIVFAIYDDKNTGMKHNPNGNLKPFEEELEK